MDEVLAEEDHLNGKINVLKKWLTDMKTPIFGKCPACGTEVEFSYSGLYRAWYCVTCRESHLELWNASRKQWVRQIKK